MGYTHYWTPNKDLTKDQRKAMVDFTRKAIKQSGVTIKGWDGTGRPTLSQKRISFNGDANIGDDHETFSMLVKSNWSFCKTAHKPYDTVVVACLIKAEQLGIIKEWSSDGCLGDGDFNEGIELHSRVEEKNGNMFATSDYIKAREELDKEFPV